MKDLKKLRADRAAKIARGKAATTEYNALQAKADRTAEDDARLVALDGELNTLETEVEALDTEISAEERSIRRAGLFLTPAAGHNTNNLARGHRRSERHTVYRAGREHRRGMPCNHISIA